MPTGRATIRQFRGVNNTLSPRDLEDNQLTSALNTFMLENGELALRPQTQSIAELSPATSLFNTANENCAINQLASGELVLWYGGVLIRPFLNSFGADGGTLVSASAQAGRPGFFHNRGRLIVMTGEVQPGYCIDATGVTTPLGAEWAVKIRPRFAAAYRGMYVFAGHDGNQVAFSNRIGDGITKLITEANWLNVGEDDGDVIVGLSDLAIEGGATFIEPYLLVFKKHSVWMGQGEPPTDSDEGTISFAQIVQNEGLVAPETVCKTPFGVVWCSGQNVWIAPYGGSPTKIGDDIRKLLSSCAPGDKTAWHAVYADGYYRLTIPVSNGSLSGPGPAMAQTEQWWLDLRQYQDQGKHAWWGPMTIPAAASFVRRLPDGSTQNVQMFFDGSTRYVVDANVNTAYHNDAHTGFFTVMTGPEQNIRFKEFDFGDPMIKRVIQSWSMELRCDQPENLAVEMWGNGMSINQNPSDLTFAPSGFVLDSSALDSAGMSNEFQVVTAHPPNSGRFVARTFQPVVRTTAAPATLTTPSTAPDLRLRALDLRVRPLGRPPT